MDAETLRAQADVLRASVITFGGVHQTRLGEKSADAILNLLSTNEQMAEEIANLRHDVERHIQAANSEAERVAKLEGALREIAVETSAEEDAGENYRWDDREGALDFAYSTARAALGDNDA
ncbi:hypothetical protein [Novosphingobium sp. KN65.2]|uniref:hypothetical protein n=1 Tax=Novosphingobium sp. KN65.2 TaxID=1478134 RepID=UPI0005E3ADE4|nr:hypothetical protein [Novosphingobium sp. KN65.2]CDO34654.1 hypothetical protein SPHV1_1750006 [Novosphingobium sp. KN65.2]